MAMFVRELANIAGKVTFYGHSDTPAATDDTMLSPPLVRGVDLGPRRNAVARTFVARTALRHFHPEEDGVDVMLIRGPSPLLPAIARAARPLPVALLLVGDYSDWQPSELFPWWRNALIRIWIKVYERLQSRAFRGALVLANSPKLAEVAGDGHVREVFTSSLSARDLEHFHGSSPEHWSEATGREVPLRLMYSGRISEEKGLVDAVRALSLLRSRGWTVSLDVFGPVSDPRLVDALVGRAEEEGVSDGLAFRGYRPAGLPLLAAYASADIFVLPSRVDAFPRSIIEALAMGLPVVATRVGSIPQRLAHRVTAMLVEPGSPHELAEAIEEVSRDPKLRKMLIREGRRWAAELTNERSCRLIVDHLEERVRAASFPDRSSGRLQ
jgi:glycosyltransferase involved in cell wall biosynthesis